VPRSAFVLVLVLAGTAACSEPPTKERHQAEGAVAAARAAEAAIYAPEALQAAEAALLQYDVAVSQGDYRLALSHAIDARDLAYEAARVASDRKADARSQADRLLLELDTLIGAAEARLAGPGRATGAAAERLRAAVRDASSALQEARAAMDAHQYRQAADRLAPALERFRQDVQAAEPGRARRAG
jgi:hypothetical protein